MNRLQLEHIIRAAAAIADDPEIVVIGSQAIHAQVRNPPPEAFMSMEADVFPRNHPERADLVDGAIGELSAFHESFGYYAQGVSPGTAVLPSGWESRLVILKNSNTGSGTGLCLDVHDLVLSKYVASREKHLLFNRAIIRSGLVAENTLLDLVGHLPVGEPEQDRIRRQIRSEFAG